MGKILRLLLVGFLAFVAATVAAFVYMEWWQAIIVVVAMIFAVVLGVKLLIANLGTILGRTMIKAFEAKSQVLRGAQAEVHAVEPTTAPPISSDEDEDDGDEEGDDDDGPDETDEEESEPESPRQPSHYYRIDVTIKPAPATGPMSHWDMDDLRMVPFDQPKRSLEQMSEDGDDRSCDLHDVKVMQEDGQFGSDEQGKHAGSLRLRFVVGVPQHVRELKFQYYAEQFGRVALPAPLPQLS